MAALALGGFGPGRTEREAVKGINGQQRKKYYQSLILDKIVQ